MIKLQKSRPWPSCPWHRWVHEGLVACASVVVLAGCRGTDATGMPAVITTNPYVALQLNVRGAVLSTVAPYDTLQLIPTAYDAQKNVLPLPGPVRWTASDTLVNVSATGLVTLKHQTTSSYVVASVQDTTLNLTHADTTFISGTTTVPVSPLASFSIHPVGSDSAVLDINNGTKTVTVTALDATGKAILATSLKPHFGSANVSVASINSSSGIVSAVSPGIVRLTSTTTYYGVTKTDSLDFRIGYPDTVTVLQKAAALANGTYQYYWNFSNLVIGVGKTVFFAFNSPAVNTISKLFNVGAKLPVGDLTANAGVSVVFDDSSIAQLSTAPAAYLTAHFASNGSGNVSLQIPDSLFLVDSVIPTGVSGAGQYSVKLTKYCHTAPFPCATARTFPTAGTYDFHNATTGAAGTITVVAQ